MNANSKKNAGDILIVDVVIKHKTPGDNMTSIYKLLETRICSFT
jgi:hypothetical protein